MDESTLQAALEAASDAGDLDARALLVMFGSWKRHTETASELGISPEPDATGDR